MPLHCSTYARERSQPIEQSTLLNLYANISSGVRICAVYNDDLYFFTIPPDLLTNIHPQALPSSIIGSPALGHPTDNTFRKIYDYTITGSKIGTVHKTVNITVSTNPEGKVYIYAFSALGSIYTFTAPSSDFSGTKYHSIEKTSLEQTYGVHDNPHETHFVIRGDTVASEQMDGLVELGVDWSWGNHRTIKVPDDYHNSSFPVIDVEVYGSEDDYNVVTVMNSTSAF